MKKSTFAKKNTVPGLIKMAADMGVELEEGLKKPALVDILYPLNIAADAVSDKNTTDVENAVKDEKVAPSTAQESVSELAGMDADSVIQAVFSKGLLYKVDAHTWWAKSTVSRDKEVEKLGKSKKVVGITKTLVDPKEIGHIKTFRGKGERAVTKHSFPFLGMRGVRFVPKMFIKKVEEGLLDAKKDHDLAVVDFCKDFDKIKDNWKPQLGDLYDEDLYPSMDTIENSFSFEWTKFRLDVPQDMMSDEEYKDEVEKQKANLIEFMDSTITALAGQLYEMIKKVNEKLKSGKPVNMKSVSTIQEFVKNFKDMDISGNTTLQALVDSTAKVFGTVDKGSLTVESKVSDITEASATLMKTVETSTEACISRAINF